MDVWLLFCFFQLRLPEENNNKYSKFDTSKLMSYQGHWLWIEFNSCLKNSWNPTKAKQISNYLLFLLLFLSLLARLRIPLMEEVLGCTFFNFIDFVVVTVQVNFIQKVSFIYHHSYQRLWELKFYMKLLLCRIICQFYSIFKMLNKMDFLKIINL
mgnify:CR=1 FL=1